jgi:hypothetical protein
MFVHKSKYLKFEALQAWYPPSVKDVDPLLDQAPVVMLWQCPEALAQEFRPWIFRSKPFHTPLIDLTCTEEDLWQKLEAKSCRYEIRKAQKMDCVISVNEDQEAARILINDSIRRGKYRDELSETAWQALLPDHDIFMCRWQGSPVVVHVLLRDFPGRARLLLSGTEDRSHERFRGILGPANRLLHWQELLAYKAKGFSFYDFGGCVLDKEASEYSITQFKLSFGAEIKTEPHLYLAKAPSLRAFLKLGAFVRSTLRKLPWPEAWIRTLKTKPQLGDLFR